MCSRDERASYSGSRFLLEIERFSSSRYRSYEMVVLRKTDQQGNVRVYFVILYFLEPYVGMTGARLSYDDLEAHR